MQLMDVVLLACVHDCNCLVCAVDTVIATGEGALQVRQWTAERRSFRGLTVLDEQLCRCLSERGSGC